MLLYIKRYKPGVGYYWKGEGQGEQRGPKRVNMVDVLYILA
jgi:hypothetical protein